jgi:hypothetical protein
MTPEDFRKRLQAMDPEDKVRFLHKAGIGGYDDDACVRMFVEGGSWERIFCQTLGEATESDKVGKATIAALWYAKWAFIVAIIALILSAISLFRW